MRIFRRGIWFSVFICCVSFFLILLSRFFHFIPTLDVFLRYREEINNTVYDISLGVFASGFVVLLTGLGSYFLEKKRNIGLTRYYCSKYVLKLSELVTLLQEANDNGKYKFDINVLKDKIFDNPIVFGCIGRLLEIHDERLITVEFCPIRRKLEKNLCVHRLLVAFARINSAIQYFSLAYMMHHSLISKSDLDDISYTFSDDEYTCFFDIILQSHGNNEYKQFLDLIEKLKHKKDRDNAFALGCEDKCL